MATTNLQITCHPARTGDGLAQDTDFADGILASERH
jgi:hypothetical protein